MIEEKKAHFNVMDADSIQLFLDQLIAKYGESDPKLNEDLTKSADARFSLLVHLVKQFRPNNRQFALAQYCVGRMSKKQRQLWCVLWGQGKSRISATAAAIAVMVQIVGKVYIIHENKHSMERDKKDFQAYWTLLGIDGSVVEYRVGINFVPEPNCLIIFDEADLFMFKHPLEFAQVINGCFCICFTATPDNKDPEGAQSKTVDILQFGRYNYLLDAQVNELPWLEMDAVVHAPSVELKAEYIMGQLANGPVLTFCDELLAEQLKIKAEGLILNVAEDTDYNVLRSLDQQPFKVVLAQDEFAMRAFDYRCEKATMTEVIAKSFSTTIEALQGFHRVGRFGDHCKRVKFQDVPMVDLQQELQQTANLFKYISSLQKTQIQVKKAAAKATTAAQPKNNGGGNLSKKQVQAAQQIVELQKKKQQQQQTITDYITTKDK